MIVCVKDCFELTHEGAAAERERDKSFFKRVKFEFFFFPTKMVVGGQHFLSQLPATTTTNQTLFI